MAVFYEKYVNKRYGKNAQSSHIWSAIRGNFEGGYFHILLYEIAIFLLKNTNK